MHVFVGVVGDAVGGVGGGLEVRIALFLPDE